MSGLPDRLFAIVDLLRGQEQLTTQALAEHFEVSERTIRRDLGRLQSLGVEVETLPGRGGGVKLPHGALLPALRFTDDEALVLALGLKRAQAAADPRLARAAQSAFKRLEHVLTEQLGERIEAVLQTLTTEAANDPAGQLPSRTLLDLAEAVRQRQRLEVRYRSREAVFTHRQLDPYGIVQVNEHWYAVGYCHLREGIRTFRLDRLEVVHVTGQHFERPEGFDPLETVSQSLAQAPFPGSLTCRVWLEADIAEASRHVPAYAATLESAQGGVLLTVQAHPDWLGRVALYLLEFPFRVKVIKPVRLREALQNLSKRARGLGRGTLA